MDCHDKTTVDICSEPECLASTVTLKQRKDLTTPHTPNHSMLKVHRILFNRDTGRVEKNAKDALDAAREVLSDLKTKKEPLPQCTHCKKTVSQPCWYCVDCTSKFRSVGIIQIVTPANTAPRRGEVHLRRLRVQIPRLQRNSHQEAHPRQGCREGCRNSRLDGGATTGCRGTT